jgi:3-oxoacyl-[acyl-carrier-protein] synthase-3
LTNALNFDVSNACSGMMSGVHFLNNLISSGIIRNGIVVSGEQISPIADNAVKEIVEPWDTQFGSLTVGDSAAAVILDNQGNAEDYIDYLELTTCAEYSDLCIGKPSIEHCGYALYTNNTEMHKNERLSMWPKFLGAMLKERNTTFEKEKFDFIVQHQVGTRFIHKVNKIGETIFETKMPDTLSIVEEFGNTATTSHFVVLHKFLKENKTRDDKTKILFIPAASGLVTGALSATFSHIGVA